MVVLQKNDVRLLLLFALPNRRQYGGKDYYILNIGAAERLREGPKLFQGAYGVIKFPRCPYDEDNYFPQSCVKLTLAHTIVHEVSATVI